MTRRLRTGQPLEGIAHDDSQCRSPSTSERVAVRSRYSRRGREDVKYWLLAAENKTSAYEMTRGSSQSAGGWDSSLSTVTRLEVEEGDAVLLWRRGRGGGVVALGEITSTTPVDSDTLDWPHARLIERRRGIDSPTCESASVLRQALVRRPCLGLGTPDFRP
ncbi:EVE domain-containing protein [Streptomyces sp. bgisy100]|uniref:EVE domain-containing protein n=1 Tax=Streptomyces sp. bgisy100 TaxID=3413783 RepID=UPI003D705B22